MLVVSILVDVFKIYNIIGTVNIRPSIPVEFKKMTSKKSFFCMNTLKQFDAFAKPLEEVQIKTVWGGIGKDELLYYRHFSFQVLVVVIDFWLFIF